ncbi:MAG: hypothetical protein A2096_10990 [Spirochaetes bacterium GWF1_41_5]|nr:MAG: hypothetical protein A2096_10990 [Spirochaetes bacterium GWF1_41_5]HBE01741.1 hypothetical protein [Spirochaetia bacterium]
MLKNWLRTKKAVLQKIAMLLLAACAAAFIRRNFFPVNDLSAVNTEHEKYREVFVHGPVKNPGIFRFTEKTTIGEAIETCGGLKYGYIIDPETEKTNISGYEINIINYTKERKNYTRSSRYY